MFILLKIKSEGKLIEVEVKIKDDWEEKREFNYLKNVEIKERFVLKTIEKYNNRYCSSNYNLEGHLRTNELNPYKNIFNVKISDASKIFPSVQLNKTVVIEIANNQLIENLLPGFDKRVF